jgi:uncharacterized protein
MINKNYNYAIIGASNNEEKYGYKVLKDLLNKGFNVIPFNIKEKEILGLKVYCSLSDYYIDNQKIDVVIFIVPSKITETVLLEVKKLNINKVWMQPGSESQDSIEYCKENNIELIHNDCIIIRTTEIN